MQLEQLQHQLDSINREIIRLESQLASITAREGAKLKQLNDARNAATKCSSLSQAQSKHRNAEQYSNELKGILNAKTRISNLIAHKNGEKCNVEAKLGKQRIEEEKKRQEEHKRLLNGFNSHMALQRSSAFLSLIQPSHNLSTMHSTPPSVPKYDVFISYASEDKETFVSPLVKCLQSRNINVWWDDQNIKWGDSIRQKIDFGLTNSRLGIVVISPEYLEKYWTKYEYNGLLQQEASINKQPIVLPIWHRISKTEIMKYSPTLADRSALNTTSFTPDEIAQELEKLLQEIKD